MRPLLNKIYPNFSDAIKDIPNNSTIMVGGFGLCGIPQNLINALKEAAINNLTIISNNCGTTDKGLGILLKNGQIKKMISSYVGENKEFEYQFLNGLLEVELMPQGTLAEKIRSYGAGIPGFFTASGVGTFVEYGGLPILYSNAGEVIKTSLPKETKIFNNKKYVLEESLGADFALIKAHKADKFGNLIFRKTARNFNPMMATAAKITIVEAQHIVEIGQLEPDEIHLSGSYVDRIIKIDHEERLLENLNVREDTHG